jgi:exopolysaccharide biosynthesis polyprenyl glycosylphosphotransferase
VSSAHSSVVVGLVRAPRRTPAHDHAAELARKPGASARHWIRRNIAGLLTLEILIAALAGATVVSTQPGAVPHGDPLFWASFGLIVAWPALLASAGAYSSRIFGAGSDEYRRVGRAGLTLLALASFTSYAGQLDLSRGLVGIAVPTLTLLTLLGRYLARFRLQRLWASGRCTKRVVVVGRGGAVLELAARLERDRYAGLQVVAACVTRDDESRVARGSGLPVGGLEDVVAMAAEYRADTIAVTSASETAAEYLRSLSWQLEGSGLELLVAPGLIEVAGPRLHIRPIEGLPLLSVEQPRFEGWPRLVKGAADRLTAAVALILLAPVLLAIAAAVAATSAGPVLYRQERIGMNGRPFQILKFRTMVPDADQLLATLEHANASDGLLFKLRHDPRVTPLGRVLRRFSLDELPQLLNVLAGSMSLVGPRPPLPTEVARYDTSVRRRLLVKPGLTGLWQISGRSDLSWEESVRLDLRYVENWSFAMDALILWKTGRAVMSSSGAY